MFQVERQDHRKMEVCFQTNDGTYFRARERQGQRDKERGTERE